MANEEQLEILKKAPKFGISGRDNSLTKIELSKANLEGIDLFRVDLNKANLAGSYFRDAEYS